MGLASILPKLQTGAFETQARGGLVMGALALEVIQGHGAFRPRLAGTAGRIAANRAG
jgi:hypothetical protein